MLSFFSIFHFGGHCSRQNQKTLPRPSPVREGDASTKDRVPSNVQPHASPPFLPSLEGRSKRSWYTLYLEGSSLTNNIVAIKANAEEKLWVPGWWGQVSAACPLCVETRCFEESDKCFCPYIRISQAFLSGSLCALVVWGIYKEREAGL